MARVRTTPPLSSFAVLLALLLGLAVFGQGLWQGTSQILGREYVDAWGTQWFYWFVGRQIAHGEGFGHTDLFFYPWGKDIYLHTGGNVLDALLAWPVRYLLGPIAGYNVFVLGLVATNLAAMRRLLLRLGAEARAATLAAVFFAFDPFLLHELRDGRPTQALLTFLLLFFADYLALDTDPRRWLPARAGLWLALAGLTYWFYALFAGMAAAVLALVRVAAGPDRARALVRHGAAGVVALVLVLPFALPMLQSTDVPGLLDVTGWTLTSWSPTTAEGVNIGMYVFDPATLTSGFYALKGTGGMAFLPSDANVFVPQLLLMLVGALAAPSRVRRAAFVLLGVSFLLAVGPTFGGGVPNVVYLAIVQASSVFQRLWWPSRALVLGQIGLAVLAAWAFGRFGRFAPAAAALVAVWWAWDLHGTELAPVATWPSGIPAAYRCLAQATEGAIIELPYAHTQAHLYYQTAHGRPIFGGMVEDNPVFAPKEQVAIQKDNSFLAVLLDQAASGNKAPVFDPYDRAKLHTMGYRWVVLDKRAYVDVGDSEARVGVSHEGRARWVRKMFTNLLGAPVYEDEQSAIYAPWSDGSPCPDGLGK